MVDMMRSKDDIEFFDLVGRLVGKKRTTIRNEWRQFFEVIIRELYTSGMVCLPGIGYMTLKHYPAQIQKQINKDGTVQYFEVPERDRPIFLPNDDFINDINMKGVTKSYRRRVKDGNLTLRDKEREKRALEIIGTEYEEIPEAQQDKIKQFESEFELLVENKRNQYEQKLKDYEKGIKDES